MCLWSTAGRLWKIPGWNPRRYPPMMGLATDRIGQPFCFLLEDMAVKTVLGIAGFALLLLVHFSTKWHFLFPSDSCGRNIQTFIEFCKTLDLVTTSPGALDRELKLICGDVHLADHLSCVDSRHSASKVVLKYVCSEGQAKNSCPHGPLDYPIVLKAERFEDSVDLELDALNVSSVEEWMEDFVRTIELNYGQSICGENSTTCLKLFRKEVELVKSIASDNQRFPQEATLLLRTAELLPEVIWSRLAPELFPDVKSYRFPWYAVEFVDPLDGIASAADVASRLNIAKDLIKFVLTMNIYASSKFQDLLLLCDLKLEHFGRTTTRNKEGNPAGSIKILDADTVYLRSHLPRSIFLNGKGCRSDEDCDFFDCKSIFVCQKAQCVYSTSGDLHEHHTQARLLQTVCEKTIFPWNSEGAGFWFNLAAKFLITSRPRRLLPDLDARTIRTLLPVCDVYLGNAWEKTEL